MATGKKVNVTKATKTVKQISLEEAHKKIADKNKADVEACTKEYNETVSKIFEKHGCTAVIIGEFAGGQIRTQLQITKAQ